MHLTLSLNTIQAAYDQLCSEGYLESKPRKGLFVTAFEEDLFPNQMNEQEIPVTVEKETANIKIDFNSGHVDLGHFPYSTWRKLSIQSLYEDQADLFKNGDPQGDLPLREIIVRYLFESRGVKCSSNQIIIGAGTQYLMGMLCMLIGKDQIFALENPGFHRTKAVFQDQGVETRSIPLDKDGIDVNQLKNSDASILYVTPSHQFPLGIVMPISRRMELLKWAEEKDGYIIEDDYDGEYRYQGKTIPSLQGLDNNGRVIYLGTFSKSLIPSIRLSYMVLPLNLVERYLEHYTIYKQTVSRLHQNTLFHFMNEGHWQRHLNKMRTLYRKKHRALILAINKYLGNQVNVIGEKSGLHIVLEVQNQMTEKELINAALESGVKVYPLSIYCDDFIEAGSKVLLGFGGLSELEIEEGIRKLREAWNL
jgi:GntR family transcriptional regulator/MocR family aminotransferase